MYKPYIKPVIKASPDIQLHEPRISKFVIFLLRLFGKLYLFLYFGVTKTILRGDNLLEVFKRALAGESRCIIAFRHPNAGEPQMLTLFFLFNLRAIAARKGIRFARWPHAVFVYSYYVVLYGGWVSRLVMPNVGAMPVYHSKIDSKGMNRIIKAITEGPYPLAIAPEGQVSYTTDSVPRMEPGVIRIGLNAARQLKEKNKNIDVEILPLSVHFHFGVIGRLMMFRLLGKIEKLCGFKRREVKKLSFPERLRLCRDYILDTNESRYKIKTDTSASFEIRLEKIRNAALETAERMLDISWQKTENENKGDFFTRMHKVRQICWDRIYLHGVYTLDNIPKIQRSILDLAAGEAWYISRHQELADLCWYFLSQIPTEETALHNKIEYVQNLYDLASRTMGGAFANRKNILIRKVIIKTAPPINLTERLDKYKSDKKTTIADSLSELENAYLDCIDEMNKTERNKKLK